MYPDCGHASKGELDVPNPQIGDFGEITMTVEITGVDKDGISWIKHGPYRVTKPFSEMSADQMKEKIGTVEDNEEPMQKDSEGEDYNG